MNHPSFYPLPQKIAPGIQKNCLYKLIHQRSSSNDSLPCSSRNHYRDLSSTSIGGSKIGSRVWTAASWTAAKVDNQLLATFEDFSRISHSDYWSIYKINPVNKSPSGSCLIHGNVGASFNKWWDSPSSHQHRLGIREDNAGIWQTSSAVSSVVVEFLTPYRWAVFTDSKAKHPVYENFYLFRFELLIPRTV